ncbi:hypothetical protein BJ878DRAFT_540451 [Calycina marina]|uniref:Uncharacterized protein n=1 Tax=Calycina marina TaxID=1763456 RepID=A0A9P7Z6K5_9HELO|nr:hypothetical protein BJ878DRAFT_540451 [Calycina marina]
MSSQFAIRIARAFDISFAKIPNPVCPKGYDGKSGAPMDRALLAYMTLMGRRIATPFLITDLGNHDIIIGQRFLKHFSILTDSRNYTLHWPERFPPTPVFQRELAFPHSASTFEAWKRSAYRTMENEIHASAKPQPDAQPRDSQRTLWHDAPRTNLHIAAISAEAFHTVYLQQPDKHGEVYICSLREIGQEIARRQTQE